MRISGDADLWGCDLQDAVVTHRPFSQTGAMTTFATPPTFDTAAAAAMVEEGWRDGWVRPGASGVGDDTAAAAAAVPTTYAVMYRRHAAPGPGPLAASR